MLNSLGVTQWYSNARKGMGCLWGFLSCFVLLLVEKSSQKVTEQKGGPEHRKERHVQVWPHHGGPRITPGREEPNGPLPSSPCDFRRENRGSERSKWLLRVTDIRKDQERQRRWKRWGEKISELERLRTLLPSQLGPSTKPPPSLCACGPVPMWVHVPLGRPRYREIDVPSEFPPTSEPTWAEFTKKRGVLLSKEETQIGGGGQQGSEELRLKWDHGHFFIYLYIPISVTNECYFHNKEIKWQPHPPPHPYNSHKSLLIVKNLWSFSMITLLSRAYPKLSFFPFTISLHIWSEVVTIFFFVTFSSFSGTLFHLVALPKSLPSFKVQIQHYLLHDVFPYMSSWKQISCLFSHHVLCSMVICKLSIKIQ